MDSLHNALISAAIAAATLAVPAPNTQDEPETKLDAQIAAIHEQIAEASAANAAAATALRRVDRITTMLHDRLRRSELRVTELENALADALQPDEQKFLFSAMPDSPAIRDRYDEWGGVLPAINVSPRAFNPDSVEPWTYTSRETAQKFFADHIPVDFAGVLMLDIEQPTHVLKTIDHPDRAHVVRQLILAVQEAKRLRPNASVGIYSTPTREIWNQNEDWRRAMRSLQPLWDVVDVMLPSVYMFYPPTPREPDFFSLRDRDWAAGLVKFAIELAGDKPVLLVTLRRWHGGGSTDGWESVPAGLWAFHIRSLLEADHDGRTAAGVLIWQPDQWFADQRMRLPDTAEKRRWRFVMEQEKRSNETDQQYIDRIAETTYAEAALALGRRN